MKKNLTIVMGVLLSLSWYVTISSWFGNTEKYQEYLEEAKRLEEKGLYLDALEEYENARKIKGDSKEIEERIAHDYLAMGDLKKYRNKLNEMIEEYGPEEQNVNKLVDYYKEYSSENSLVDSLNELYKKYPESEIVKKHYNAVKGFYDEKYLSLNFIEEFYGKYAVFELNGKKGILKQNGDICVEAVYDEIIYNGKNEDNITVRDGNSYFFINIDGYKTKNLDENYDEVGALSNKRILVKKDGKYGYLDAELEVKIEPQYEEATSFFENLAAVKKGNKWAVINRDGEEVTEYIYDGVAVNSRNICSVNKIIGVCQKGIWFFIDEDGEKIGENTYQEIKAFESGQPCAVSINKKWGFCDKEGNMVFECNYEDAKAFENGYAAIKENNLWGFIDLENYKFIKGSFDEVQNMTSEGIAPVSRGGNWTLIELKVMN